MGPCASTRTNIDTWMKRNKNEVAKRKRKSESNVGGTWTGIFNLRARNGRKSYTRSDIPANSATPEADPGVRGSRQADLPTIVEGGSDGSAEVGRYNPFRHAQSHQDNHAWITGSELLFVPERDHRVHARGSPRRHPAGGERHDQQQRRNRGEGQRIGRRDPEQERPQEARHGQRPEPHRAPRPWRSARAPVQHQPQHVARAAPSAIRTPISRCRCDNDDQHAVDAHHGQKKRKDREGPHQPRVERSWATDADTRWSIVATSSSGRFGSTSARMPRSAGTSRADHSPCGPPAHPRWTPAAALPACAVLM